MAPVIERAQVDTRADIINITLSQDYRTAELHLERRDLGAFETVAAIRVQSTVLADTSVRTDRPGRYSYRVAARLRQNSHDYATDFSEVVTVEVLGLACADPIEVEYTNMPFEPTIPVMPSPPGLVGSYGGGPRIYNDSPELVWHLRVPSGQLLIYLAFDVDDDLDLFLLDGCRTDSVVAKSVDFTWAGQRQPAERILHTQGGGEYILVADSPTARVANASKVFLIVDVAPLASNTLRASYNAATRTVALSGSRSLSYRTMALYDPTIADSLGERTIHIPRTEAIFAPEEASLFVIPNDYDTNRYAYLNFAILWVSGMSMIPCPNAINPPHPDRGPISVEPSGIAFSRLPDNNECCFRLLN